MLGDRLPGGILGRLSCVGSPADCIARHQIVVHVCMPKLLSKSGTIVTAADTSMWLDRDCIWVL